MIVHRHAFDELLARFSIFYPTKPRHQRGGRPPKFMYHHQVLGLLVRFYVSSDDQSSVCLVFGAPPSTVSRVLCKAEQALERALANYHPACISWPSPRGQIELAWLVQAREPQLKRTFGFIDGKNFRVRAPVAVAVSTRLSTLTPRHPYNQVQQPSQTDLQNALYNGWLHSDLVTGTLCFASDGCIVWAKHNCPGSWNNADTSAGFRDKLLDTRLCPDQRHGAPPTWSEES